MRSLLLAALVLLCLRDPARAESSPGQINLARTSLAWVSANSVNGRGAMDNPYHGLLNAFDGEVGRDPGAAGAFWTTDSFEVDREKAAVEIQFDVPVTVASISIVAQRFFTARLTDAGGRERTHVGDDILLLEPPAPSTRRLRLELHGVESSPFQPGFGVVVVSEIRIMGFVPPGTVYEVRSPRVLPSPKNLELAADEVFRGWVHEQLRSRTRRVESTAETLSFTYHFADVPLLRVTIDRSDGSLTVEPFPPPEAPSPVHARRPGAGAAPSAETAPEPREPVNLGRTSLARVSASSVNGGRAMEDEHYGVLNAFDAGENWLDGILYDSWLPRDCDAGCAVEMELGAPARVSAIAIEGGRYFTARLTDGVGEEQAHVGKGSLSLDPPATGIRRLRLEIDTTKVPSSQGGWLSPGVKEILVMGTFPPGTRYEVGRPRVIPTQENLELTAESAFARWLQLSSRDRTRIVRYAGNAVIYVYFIEEVPVLRVTSRLQDGARVVEVFSAQNPLDDEISGGPHQQRLRSSEHLHATHH